MNIQLDNTVLVVVAFFQLPLLGSFCGNMFWVKVTLVCIVSRSDFSQMVLYVYVKLSVLDVDSPQTLKVIKVAVLFTSVCAKKLQSFGYDRLECTQISACQCTPILFGVSSFTYKKETAQSTQISLKILNLQQS
eukprot:TRINITY_DN3864_c0_g1_i1.p4 TRINITY_DN3864_c0_g1~~TRINITY_DN3864_c0_g1_i1.p4  ORF type:complete len:134 (-),score=4.28 TRINITY_DN3864_c0_g1_i1:1148-1549(-)